MNKIMVLIQPVGYYITFVALYHFVPSWLYICEHDTLQFDLA